MLETIEEKCQKNGVKLTDQRRISQELSPNQKKHMENLTIQTLMSYITEFLK